MDNNTPLEVRAILFATSDEPFATIDTFQVLLLNQLITVPKKTLTLEANVFRSNLAGNGGSVVSIEGFPAVVLIATEFTDNGNILTSIFRIYSPIFLNVQSSKTSPAPDLPD
jgi:hypothetical protein